MHLVDEEGFRLIGETEDGYSVSGRSGIIPVGNVEVGVGESWVGSGDEDLGC